MNTNSCIGSTSSTTACDLVKDMPSLRSFACTINYDGSSGVSDIEKQIKGKWKLE